jgi:hypothetical protein
VTGLVNQGPGSGKPLMQHRKCTPPACCMSLRCNRPTEACYSAAQVHSTPAGCLALCLLIYSSNYPIYTFHSSYLVPHICTRPCCRYVYSMYWSIITFATVGYGDFHAYR